MEGFIQFFKALFLSKAFLLTPVPIDLDVHWVQISLQEPLTALTVGAAVQVRLRTTEEFFRDSENLLTDLEIAEKFIPQGTILAEMTDAQGNVLIFANKHILLGNDYVVYTINGEKPFPLGLEYTKLRIKSNKPIQGVQIYWKNFRL